MTLKLKYGIAGVGIGLVLMLLAIGFRSQIARAAISVFSPATCYTAAATTTLNYMTPGAATTTVTCALGIEGAKSATVNYIVNASSTSAVFTSYVEESMDGIDWFPAPINQEASSTRPIDLNLRDYVTFTFASSTIGGGVAGELLGANGTNNRNHYEAVIPVRMKHVRVHTGLTGVNAGLWVRIVPRIDIN